MTNSRFISSSATKKLLSSRRKPRQPSSTCSRVLSCASAYAKRSVRRYSSSSLAFRILITGSYQESSMSIKFWSSSNSNLKSESAYRQCTLLTNRVAEQHRTSRTETLRYHLPSSIKSSAALRRRTR